MQRGTGGEGAGWNLGVGELNEALLLPVGMAADAQRPRLRINPQPRIPALGRRVEVMKNARASVWVSAGGNAVVRGVPPGRAARS